MTTRRSVIASALLGAAGVAIAAPAKAASKFVIGAVRGDQTLISGCVIRFLPEHDGYPSIHANGAHVAAGVKDVSVNQHGHIVAHQTITDPAKHPIIFAFVQPDETFATRGIIGGASGGTGTTRFWLYDTKLDRPLDLTKQSDRHRVMGKNANLWLGFVHLRGGVL